MGQFFSYFPVVTYDIAKNDYANYQVATNIFFRVGLIKNALDNISSYYIYDIKESETPEILADKVYGTSEAHWIILMANDRLDAQYDWPLEYKDFNRYIANKYRTEAGGETLTDGEVISWAQQLEANTGSIHHYEKVIERTDMSSDTTTIFRYVIDYENKTDEIISVEAIYTPVPYDYYITLPATGYYENYTINGKTVREKIYRNMVTVYDYEFQANENKRQIKIIKPEYYAQIVNELKKLAGVKDVHMRKLV